MKYYKLRKHEKDQVLPGISGMFVKGKEDFFDTDEAGANRFYQHDYVFDYLVPIYHDELEQVDEPPVYADYSLWHFEQPMGGNFTPVSPSFKALIEQFNCPANKFYDAKLLHKGRLHPFYVWQVYSGVYLDYIDFELTEFNNLKTSRMLKQGETLAVKKFTSLKALKAYSKNCWGFNWNYHRLVLKPAFRELDYCIIPTKLGVVVSEGLKEAIEAADLIGIQCIELPIKLEFSDTYEK